MQMTKKIIENFDFVNHLENYQLDFSKLDQQENRLKNIINLYFMAGHQNFETIQRIMQLVNIKLAEIENLRRDTILLSLQFLEGFFKSTEFKNKVVGNLVPLQKIVVSIEKLNNGYRTQIHRAKVKNQIEAINIIDATGTKTADTWEDVINITKFDMKTLPLKSDKNHTNRNLISGNVSENRVIFEQYCRAKGIIIEIEKNGAKTKYFHEETTK
jgi:hypothetical protein